jgi:predicted Zn finger-like uncharacterized protein
MRRGLDVIITCEQCSTRFQLADSRIPERGVRVRCSRCKHAFVAKRVASSGDPVEQAVQQALVEDVEEAAGASEGLRPGGAVAVAAQESASTEDGLEESDWEFNDDAPALDSPSPLEPAASKDAGLTAAREAVDDLLSGDSGYSGGGEMDDLLGTESELDEEVDSLLSGQLEGPDLDAGELTEPLAQEAASAAEEGMFPAHEVVLAAPETVADASPEAGPSPAGNDELGSPENWDFFAEEAEDAAPERAAPQAPQGLVLGRIGQGAGQTPLDSVRPPIDVDAEPSKIPAWLGRAGQGVGWASVALLALVGLYQGTLRQAPASSSAQTAQTVAGFEAAGVEGRWIENAVAGPIYVVSGVLRGAGSHALDSGAWLTVRLFGERGELLADQAAALGPALPAARLRQEDPRELREIQASRARSVVWTPFGARDARPFQAILTQVHPRARRFDLAAVVEDVSATGAEGPGAAEALAGEANPARGEAP